ncbi:MAG: hypothetical protein FJX78_06220 [Armatimonadetes bacterium]|nr:hypothetical protein [Armatimonadota bacterium]
MMGAAAAARYSSFMGSVRQIAEIYEHALRHGAATVRAFEAVGNDTAVPGSFVAEMETESARFEIGALLSDLEILLGCPLTVSLRRGPRGRVTYRILREPAPASTS